MNERNYTIRVYALILHNNSILLTDEFRAGMRMTKFPGGGHEWGESLPETLVRECEEELNQTPVHYSHFYTTDFFVTSAFCATDQLIAIYYITELPDPEKIETRSKPFDFEEEKNGAQIFRWVKLDQLRADEVTFPIDKKVVRLLIDNSR
jgi:8-oxo-dGTP pyrophosphatase MutT (NUDIX family)